MQNLICEQQQTKDYNSHGTCVKQFPLPVKLTWKNLAEEDVSPGILKQLMELGRAHLSTSER